MYFEHNQQIIKLNFRKATQHAFEIILQIAKLKDVASVCISLGENNSNLLKVKYLSRVLTILKLVVRKKWFLAHDIYIMKMN